MYLHSFAMGCIFNHPGHSGSLSISDTVSLNPSWPLSPTVWYMVSLCFSQTQCPFIHTGLCVSLSMWDIIFLCPSRTQCLLVYLGHPVAQFISATLSFSFSGKRWLSFYLGHNVFFLFWDMLSPCLSEINCLSVFWDKVSFCLSWILGLFGFLGHSGTPSF